MLDLTEKSSNLQICFCFLFQAVKNSIRLLSRGPRVFVLSCEVTVF